MDSSYTNLISILNLPQKEIEKIYRKGSKIFVETKNNPKGKYVGRNKENDIIKFIKGQISFYLLLFIKD